MAGRVIDTDKVVRYVQGLRKDTGGFGATRRLPATVEDTFHAVTLFGVLSTTFGRPGELDGCRADDSLLGYLERLWPGAGLDLKTVAQLAGLAGALDASFDRAPLRPLAAHRFRRQPGLFAAFHTSRILGADSKPLLEETLGSGWAGRLAPARATAEELMMWLAVITTAGLPVTAGELEQRYDLGLGGRSLAGWLQDCQTPDGGFGFLPGTTSFIENGFFCLRGLGLLGAVPKDSRAAAAFIANCQTRNGGFGRRGHSAPFLDSTCYALQAWSLLAGFGGRGNSHRPLLEDWFVPRR